MPDESEAWPTARQARKVLEVYLFRPWCGTGPMVHSKRKRLEARKVRWENRTVSSVRQRCRDAQVKGRPSTNHGGRYDELCHIEQDLWVRGCWRVRLLAKANPRTYDHPHTVVANSKQITFRAVAIATSSAGITSDAHVRSCACLPEKNTQARCAWGRFECV